MSYPHPDDPHHDMLVDFLERDDLMPEIDEDLSDALRDSRLDKDIEMSLAIDATIASTCNRHEAVLIPDEYAPF